MTQVIAELGINHNGSLDLAMDLATAAKGAGAHYIKLQKRDIEMCYTPEQLAKPCESPWGSTISDKVNGRELDWDAVHQLDQHCQNIGIQWFSSCFDLRSLAELHEFFPERPFNKVPSAMALHSEFLRAVAGQGLPTLISTGLLTDEGIKDAARYFEHAGCPYYINHCISLYPCRDLARLNLNVITKLQLYFSDWKHCQGIGYSGHEVGILPSVIAAQLGAVFVERHLTLDRAMYGADQAASLEPIGLCRLVRDINELGVIGGTGERVFMGDEKNPVPFFRSL